METGRRIWVKAIFWQILGLVVMSAVGFAFTGSVMTGGIIAVVNTAIGFFTYLVYEHVWRHVNWGRDFGGWAQ